MHDQLQKIHESSMRILARTGIRIFHPEAIALLKANGIKEKDGIFFPTESQIMKWVGLVPSSFTFHARNSEHDSFFGGDNLIIAPGYGAPMICDQQGRKRDATLDDYIKMCRLYQANPLYKANGGIIVQPTDVPPDIAPIVMHYAALTNSDKCLQTSSGTRQQVEIMMKMTEIVYGSLDKPCMFTIVNTNSPLQLDPVMTETLLAFAERGQPVAVSASAMAGTTGPITLAGTIAVANAEALATIALAQMANPGVPTVYGSQSVTSDMATGGMAAGAPESALCFKYGAHMAKFYNLPSRGGGCVTDAKVVNGQSGYESMLTYLATAGAGTNYIIHSAGIMDSYACMSYEKLIMDFEINRVVARFLKGVDVTPDSLQEDMINEVGPGGNYMMQRHTLKCCRKVTFLPEIGVRGNVANPGRQFEMNIEKKMTSMLAGYQQPQLPEAVDEELRNYLKDQGIDIRLYIQ